MVHSLLENALPEITVPVPLFGGPFRGMAMNVNLKWEREFVYGRFEFEVAKAIQEHVKPGDVVYDVGAHAGYFTLLLARLVGPKGQCFGFEANPRVFDRLEANIRMNKRRLPARVETMRLGIYDEVGEKMFFLGGSTSTGRFTGFPGNLPDSQFVLAPLSTIDRLVQNGLRPPNLIKIDVENAEDHVLRGAIQTLTMNDVVILCEIHSLESGRNCLEVLRGMDYSVTDLKTGEIWDRMECVSKGNVVARPQNENPTEGDQST